MRKFPDASTVVGRIVVYRDGKHLELGTYVGDNAVVLSADGERLMAPAKTEEKKPDDGVGAGDTVEA